MNKSYLQKKIKDLFIVQENDGTYNLFGTYIVCPQTNGTFRVNVVDSDYHRDAVELSTLKYAVSWCVFEKNNKHKERERLYELDQTLSSLNVNLAQHKKLAEKAQLPDKFIYLAKLNEDKLKKRKAMEELEQYTTLSRYIQSKKYTESKDEN